LVISEGIVMLPKAVICASISSDLRPALESLVAVVGQKEEKPDLYILDCEKDPINSLELGRRIKQQFPNTNLLLVVNQYVLNKYHNLISRCPITGLVSNTCLHSDLKDGINQVSQGKYFCDPALIDPNRRDEP